jgi:hypothetical protein
MSIEKFESSDEIMEIRNRGAGLKILITQDSKNKDSQLISANDFYEEPEFKMARKTKSDVLMSPSTAQKSKQRFKLIINSDVEFGGWENQPKKMGIFCMDSFKSCKGKLDC